MQVVNSFLDKIKFATFWHITRISTANRRKVINSEKQSGFLAHPVEVTLSSLSAAVFIKRILANRQLNGWVNWQLNLTGIPETGQVLFT